MRYLAAHLACTLLVFMLFVAIALLVAGWGANPFDPFHTA